MSDEVVQAFATLRQHLPETLRAQEAQLEAAWFNGGPVPVFWPARFRVAADAAEETGAEGLFLALADEVRRLPDEMVEALTRALLGRAGR